MMITTLKFTPAMIDAIQRAGVREGAIEDGDLSTEHRMRLWLSGLVYGALKWGIGNDEIARDFVALNCADITLTADNSERGV